MNAGAETAARGARKPLSQAACTTRDSGVLSRLSGAWTMNRDTSRATPVQASAGLRAMTSDLAVVAEAGLEPALPKEADF